MTINMLNKVVMPRTLLHEREKTIVVKDPPLIVRLRVKSSLRDIVVTKSQ